MKKYFLILLLPLVYFIGFTHGVNSEVVEEKIQKIIVNKDNDNFEKMISTTFGVIQIEVVDKDINSAESDFVVKTSQAKLNRWIMVGSKKVEKLTDGYKIQQDAMRFKD